MKDKLTMTLEKYGVRFSDGTEIVNLYGDERFGYAWLIRGLREQVEVRVTPKGFIRIGEPKKNRSPYPRVTE